MRISTAVKVSRDLDFTWLVWLDERIAGRFAILGEALEYAATLECSPKARAAALAAA